MRILYVHNDYGNWSGEEASVENLVKLLSDNGHEVSWFRRSSSEINSSLSGKVKAFFTGVYNPFSSKEIERILDKTKPDIVQIQNLYPLISTSIFKSIKKYHIPVVMRCPNYRLFCPTGSFFCRGEICQKCTKPGHEFWCVFKNCSEDFLKSSGYALRNAWARMTKSIIKNVNIFIVQTDFQKQQFIKNGISPDSIEILPGMQSNIDISSNGHIGDFVGFVGRPSREKGIDTFIEAAKVTPEIHFSVAGDCSTSGQYLSISPSNMQWLGFLKGDELFDMYKSSRFIVVPSNWYEGFPNVIVQAMMMGKAVITSRLGGMPEIVDDGKTGLLCEPNNHKDLSEKIKYLWGNPDLCKQMGQAGRKKVLQEYSRDKCYERLMKIYEKAIQIKKQSIEV